MSLKEKVDKLRTTAQSPVKLSDMERKQILETFKDLGTALKEAQDNVLKMNRDDAYRYVDAMLTAFSSTDDIYAGKTQAPQTAPPPVHQMASQTPAPPAPVPAPQVQRMGYKYPIVDTNTPPTGPPREAIPPPPPMSSSKLEEILSGLTPHELDIANRLECIKSFRATGETAQICPDCSPQRMKECIKTNDPAYSDAITNALSNEINSQSSQR